MNCFSIYREGLYVTKSIRWAQVRSILMYPNIKSTAYFQKNGIFLIHDKRPVGIYNNPNFFVLNAFFSAN